MTDHETKYFFIENTNPERNPNTDLNFDNDTLYDEINGFVRSNKPRKPMIKNTALRENPKREEMTNDTTETNIKKQSMVEHLRSNIYIYFVIIIILLVAIWYFYGLTQNVKTKDIIETYPDHPELTMMSPDMGLDTRFTRI